MLLEEQNNTRKRCIRLSISLSVCWWCFPQSPRTHDEIMRLRTLRRFFIRYRKTNRHAEGQLLRCVSISILLVCISVVHHPRHQHCFTLVLGKCVISHPWCRTDGITLLRPTDAEGIVSASCEALIRSIATICTMISSALNLHGQIKRIGSY